MLNCLINKDKLNLAITIIATATISGCANYPNSILAPVEDHSAKIYSKKEQNLPINEPVAKTVPLPSIADDTPLRARPLPPLITPSRPAETANAQLNAPVTIAPSSSANTSSNSGTAAPASAAAAKTSSQTPTNATAPQSSAAPQKLASIPSDQIALPTKPATAPSVNSGVVALLGKADDQAASGQIDSAAVTLERALRIEPENGRLWNELAGIRLKQGRLDSAVSLAEKSNSLARNQRDLQARNWRLIAVARQKQGQADGAAEALQRARVLEKN